MVIVISLLLSASGPALVRAGDLQQIKQQGVLRHLGIPYAHFVRKTPQGPDEYDGLDVEVMRLFAKYLGVRYQLVNTTWADLFTDLTGHKLDHQTLSLHPEKTEIIKGDIIANGLTVLPWRQKLVNYSVPTFPTGVWLISKASSQMKPIIPTGNIARDIKQVKLLLNGHSVLTMEGTCLSPELYAFDMEQVEIKLFTQSKMIDDIAQAMLDGMSDTTLLDIPNAMIALEKWPGEIKVIGPLSHGQVMGVAVPKSSTQLLKEFNRFFKQIWENGTYRSLVEKYYPSVFLYLGEFFDRQY